MVVGIRKCMNVQPLEVRKKTQMVEKEVAYLQISHPTGLEKFYAYKQLIMAKRYILERRVVLALCTVG